MTDIFAASVEMKMRWLRDLGLRSMKKVAHAKHVTAVANEAIVQVRAEEGPADDEFDPCRPGWGDFGSAVQPVTECNAARDRTHDGHGKAIIAPAALRVRAGNACTVARVCSTTVSLPHQRSGRAATVALIRAYSARASASGR